MQTLKRRSSPCKYKNDPSRFLGEGITFKAKLIGILEVNEARGDKMCQDALNDLKTAIRAAGEHKQRITINISIDGLRLRDEKTGDCLYHHPVHKISFIAQDMSDSRAFGYIFGSPDTGHRFFGIKTDKTASQVVISMRDLFQVVFELKKKEIEMSKHHSDLSHIKYGSTGYMDSIHLSKPDENDHDKGKPRYSQGVKPKNSASKSMEPPSSDLKASSASEAIADLLDLEQGINQINKITCSDPFGPLPRSDPYDPFDDSFSYAMDNPGDKRYAGVPTDRPANGSVDSEERSFFASTSKPSFFQEFSSEKSEPEVYGRWFSREEHLVFEEPSGNGMEMVNPPATASSEFDQVDTKRSPIKTDLFTELDPLGTGRVKPYVDKKDFFQELKNPPKKVLKELIGDGTTAEVSFVYFQARFPEDKNDPDSKKEPSNFPQDPKAGAGSMKVDPFTEGDPFEKTDPFREETSFPVSVDFPPLFGVKSSLEGPFEEKIIWKSEKSTVPVEDRRSKSSPTEFSVLSPVALRVSLPPENPDKVPPSTNKFKSPSNSPDHYRTATRNSYAMLRQGTESDRGEESPAVEEPFVKCKLMNPEPRTEGTGRSPYKAKFYSIRDSSSAPAPAHNAKEAFEATTPDPPPRGKTALFTIKPPPLPPKKAGHSGVRPPARPPSLEDTLPHYDYLQKKELVADGFLLQEGLKCIKLNRELFTLKDQSRATEGHKPESDGGFPVLLPPPHRKISTDVTVKATVANKQLDNVKGLSSGDGSVLDIKLTQLDATSLENLATTLGIPSENVYTMTLQDLTKVLAEKFMTFAKDEGKSTLNGTFEADFDSNFAHPEQANQNVSYDKYAVFKELIESESLGSTTPPVAGKQVDENENQGGVAGAAEKDKEEDKYEALRQLSLSSPKVTDLSRGSDNGGPRTLGGTVDESAVSGPGGSEEENKGEEEQKRKHNEKRIRGLRPASDAEDCVWEPKAIITSANRFSSPKPSTPRDNWATFENMIFPAVDGTKSVDNLNEMENSPFSSDGKEEDREVECRWQENTFRKRSEKDLPWQDDDESWDDYSPKESLCSDESSRDERSPEGRRDDKTPWTTHGRPLPWDRPHSDKSTMNQWSFRNKWQEETEDEFEDTWRKQRERTGSCDSERRAFWGGDACPEFSPGKRCDQCGVWAEDWGEATRRPPFCCGSRRKRSESDNEYRRRCDSDASDKECIWTLRPETQARVAKQNQYHSLSRFPRTDCQGRCHDACSKQRRTLDHKRVDAAGDPKRTYEVFFPDDEPAKRSVQPDDFYRRPRTWKEGKHRGQSNCVRYRARERNPCSHRSKSGGGFDSPPPEDNAFSQEKGPPRRGDSVEGGSRLQFDSEGETYESPKGAARTSLSRSPEPRSARWTAVNGRSDAPDAFSSSCPFKEPFVSSSKRVEGQREETGTERTKGGRQETTSLLRKSDSINIFSRDKDPFEGDDFFNS